MESVTWDTTGFRGMNLLTGNGFNLEALNSILQPFQERNRVLLSGRVSTQGAKGHQINPT